MSDRVLLVHNYYQQRGGEDESFVAETELLRTHGHDVITYTVHNDVISEMGSLQLASDLLWNREVYKNLKALIRREQPSLLHCNNTFPLLSPAVYYAARSEGLPVVQNLRNYRLYCSNGLFFRDGHVCEDCLGKLAPWSGVKHACYRESRTASAAVAAMLAAHRTAGTWASKVDMYVTLTKFARAKFIEAGMSGENIVVKPNFLSPVPEVGTGTGGYALFVGRLSPEKGLDTLLAAWKQLGGGMPLKIVGNGPSAPAVTEAASELPGVEWLGRQPLERVYELMGEAYLLVFPSEWYETFGRVAMEAFAKGTPVIAANIGAIAELVEHGRTGLHFQPGDPEDLARQVSWAQAHPGEWAAMRHEARRRFETDFTAERNYEMLMDIYRQACQRAGTGPWNGVSSQISDSGEAGASIGTSRNRSRSASGARVDIHHSGNAPQ